MTEVFSLDVIGDWRASLRNTEELWKRGLDVIPVFHVGESTDLLKALARDYPKIALGGAVGYRAKMEWAALCFREVWPKKIHGLGYGHMYARTLPWHSIDASSWSIGPQRYGQWVSMPSRKPIHYSRGPNPHGDGKWMRKNEVAALLRHEASARRWWNGRLPTGWGDLRPTIHLATVVAGGDIVSLNQMSDGSRSTKPQSP